MTHLPNVVYLAWQCPRSRAIVPIGRLIERAQDDYEFSYIRSVHRARELGFQALVSFPHLDVIYRSAELPPLFHNRVMRASRPDYPAFVSELGLDQSAGPLELMARSGGRRQTDELEVFAPPHLDDAGVLSTTVLVRGVRHVPHTEEAIVSLQPGEPLLVLADYQNPHAAQALALRTNGQALVGYLPDYLARELAAQAPTAGRDITVTVERVNLPPAPVHHRLLCRVEFPPSMTLFRSDDYTPIGKNAEAAE